MIFYIGLALIGAGVVAWLWAVAPKRVTRRDYYNNVDYKEWRHYFYEWYTAVFGVLGILLAGFVATLAWALVLAGIQHVAQQDYTLESENKKTLIALETDKSLNGGFVGAFFISTGYLNEKPTFNYLYQGDDDGVRVGYIYTDSGAVYEDEQDNPYRTEFIWHKYDPFISPFAASKTETYAFHVPEGSVIQGYEVTP